MANSAKDISNKEVNITAVVVTYNRKDLLIRCIEHLQQQTIPLSNILVVNNGSTDGTREWLDDQTDLEVIHQENVGGSGGFYRGIQYAYEQGCDWIWCMDDDVYPEPDCLEKLLEQDNEQTGMLCPLRKRNGEVFLSEVKKFNLSNPFCSMHCHALRQRDIDGQESVCIEGIAFEGPLIKRDVVARIGLPNKELFLLYDDSDYSFRTVLAGYEVRLVTKAVLNKEKFFADNDRQTQVKKGKWKLYYHIRNSVYFNRQYGKNVFVRNIRPFGLLLKYECYVLKNIFFNDKYILKDMRQFACAYYDGVKGMLGKKNSI